MFVKLVFVIIAVLTAVFGLGIVFSHQDPRPGFLGKFLVFGWRGDRPKVRMSRASRVLIGTSIMGFGFGLVTGWVWLGFISGISFLAIFISYYVDYARSQHEP